MNIYRFTTLFLGAVLLILPLGCSETQVAQKAAVDLKAASAAKPDPAAAKNAPIPKPAAKAETAAAEDEPAPLTVPAGYNYRAGNRRDPFVNPIPKPAVTEKKVKPVVRPEGLPGVLVSEVKISGIIHSDDPAMRKAMLATTGRRTYFAGQGDSLFDGVIKEIRPAEIVFAMVSSETRQPLNQEVIVNAGGSSATLSGEKK